MIVHDDEASLREFIGPEAKKPESVKNHTRLFLAKFDYFFKKVEKECPTREEIQKLMNKNIGNKRLEDL